MDTSIRRITPAAAASPVSDRARHTLSLPARPTVKSAFLETTAQALREAILRCAAEAQKEEQKDTEARLHCFAAKLSGCMECMGETDLDHALWDLMQLHAEPHRKTDRSGNVHAEQTGAVAL